MQENKMSGTVELFAVKGDKATLGTLRQLEELGFQVIPKGCPPSAAEWVEFPFIREPSGSSYHGTDGIDAFLQKARQGLGTHR